MGLRSFRAFVLALALALAAAAADDSTASVFSVRGRIVYPDAAAAGNPPPQAKVLLNAGEYEGLTRVDGSFVVQGVKAGVYSLEVVQPAYHFSDYKLDVAVDTGTVRALEYKFQERPKSRSRTRWCLRP